MIPDKLYPFQNESFDEVVTSYLPVLNELDINNKENFIEFYILSPQVAGTTRLERSYPSLFKYYTMKHYKVKGLFKGTYSSLPKMKAEFGLRYIFHNDTKFNKHFELCEK